MDSVSRAAANDEQEAANIISAGLLRPRIDGFLDPGSDTMMGEWQDALKMPVTFRSAEDEQSNGTLWLKNIGPSFYFALELPTRSEPTVMLVIKSNEGTPYLLVLSNGTLTIYKDDAGSWKPIEEPAKMGSGAGSSWWGLDYTDGQQQTVNQKFEFYFQATPLEAGNNELDIGVYTYPPELVMETSGMQDTDWSEPLRVDT